MGESPCLTATRSGSRGYWVSTKGRFIDVDEMARLQGYASHHDANDACPIVFAWRESGLTQSQAGHMLGNGQTLQVLEHVLICALFHAGFITYAQFVYLDDGFRRPGSHRTGSQPTPRG